MAPRRVVDTVFTPLLIALGAFPAFFTALVYFMGLKWGWFPIQHAYNTDIEPGFSLDFFQTVGRHAQLPMLVILGVFTGGWLLSMRNTMINTVGEDYVAMARARVSSRPARDDDVRGAERDPPAADGLRVAVRRRGRRARLHRVRVQLPGRRADAAAGRARLGLR